MAIGGGRIFTARLRSWRDIHEENWQLAFSNSLSWLPVFLCHALQRHIAENTKQIVPEKELHGQSPNFHIHVSWAIYRFPRLICLFCWRKISRPILGIINQTHECGNWDWGRAILRKGIHKWDFRCSVARNCIIFFDSEPQLPSPYHATLLQLFIILPRKVSVDIFTVLLLL